MIVTRRLFLIGTGAAIAAASLPPLVAETLVTPLQVLDDPQVVRRALWDVSFGALTHPKPDPTVPYFPDRIMGYSIGKKLGEPIIHNNINSRNTVRWVAALGKELIFLPGETMCVDWQGIPPGGAEIWLFYREFRADGWYRDISDCRTIDDDGNVTMVRNRCDQREWIDPDAVPEPEKISLQDRIKRWFFGAPPDLEDAWDD